MQSMPAFAAYADSEPAAFPLDAMATLLAPNSTALEMPTVFGLSLKDPVGFLVSFLT
jgi:hypothetical protein